MPRAGMGSADGQKGHNKKKKQQQQQPKVLSEEEKLAKLWRSAHDQLFGQSGRVFPQNALKTVEKLLSLRPDDDFALLAKVQILGALDRYKEAHDLLKSWEGSASHSTKHPLEMAYLLYKLRREAEALRVIEEARAAHVKLDDVQSRGLRVLEAQIRYRLEDYPTAQSIYDELLEGVEPDHPEYSDLRTNLAACAAHNDFFDSIPSRLAAMTASLPSVQQLEATPLNVLVASNAAAHASASRSKPRPAFTSALEATRSKRKKSKKEAPTRLPKLPAHIAAMPAEKRPLPDPERWLPKSERSGWASRQQAEVEAREKRRAEKRKNAKLSTQGASESTSTQKSTASGPSLGKKKGVKT